MEIEFEATFINIDKDQIRQRLKHSLFGNVGNLYQKNMVSNHI